VSDPRFVVSHNTTLLFNKSTTCVSRRQADPKNINSSEQYSCNVGLKAGMLPICYIQYIRYIVCVLGYIDK